MKPRIILSILLLICFSTIKFGSDIIIVRNDGLKKTYVAESFPPLITIENPKHEDALYYYHNQTHFKPLSQFKQIENNTKEVFWYKRKIRLSDSLSTGVYVLSFHHLTFVDLTVIDQQGRIVTNRKAGSFRKKKEINITDGRDHFVLQLDKNINYTLLLRVKHIKGYTPVYDFHLQTLSDYIINTHWIKMVHVFMEGANIVLLLYIAFAWIVSRYRPYSWIFCFLLFIGFYSFALQNEFVDLIFPNHPQFGWSLASLFRNLGGISFVLLTVEFLNLRKYNRPFYKLAITLMTIVAAEAIIVFVNNFYFANYKESNWKNILLGGIHVLFYISLFIATWKKTEPMQRFLFYATVVFITGVITVLYCWIILQEQAIQYISMLTQFFVLNITMLLLIGMRMKQRKSEQEHNKKIEFIVHERTAELSNANKALHEKQKQLIQKNNYIETLIDEVNHRVKNNLQLLYSLSSMHKTMEYRGPIAINSTQSMQDRIHAMMLVNQLLVYSQNSQLKLGILIIETVDYLRQIYDPEDKVIVELNITKDWLISTNTSIPLALIITELLTNSYKYAFPIGTVDHPKISLGMYNKGTITYMSVVDNGIGCEDFTCTASFGIKLIQDLTRQIKGTVSIEHSKGFTYLFQFNEKI
ncbi:MAG: sensor histidine kinase [Sphingobacterium sp.]